MRKYLFIILFAPVTSFAQYAVATSNTIQQLNMNREVQGTIVLPQLMDIKVDMVHSQDAVINKFEDYKSGKIYDSYFQVTVKSNKAWTLNAYVSSGGRNVNAVHDGVSTYEIKESGSSTFVPLTNAPTPVLYNTNNNIANTYTFDLKLNPGFGNKAGMYNMNVLFTLTPR